MDPIHHYNKLICEDCLTNIASFPDKSVELIVTDPPYGVSYQTNRRKRLKTHDGVMAKKIKNDESLDIVKQLLPHFYRILRDDCACYMFCSRKKMFEVHKLVTSFVPQFTFGNIIIWDKGNCTAGDLLNWGDQYEVCFYLRKGDHKLDGSRPRNLLSIPRVPSNQMVHPTEKPVELLRRIIEPSTPMGTLVLDPFAGSGSTLLAARSVGREYLGFEIDPDHYRTTKAKLSQGTLF